LVNGFIDYLHTRLGTTSNYSVTANLHNSQITTAPAKLFQTAVSSPAVPWQRLLTVEILQLHALKSSLHRLPYGTHSVSLIIFKIYPRNGLNRKHLISKSTSIVAHRFIAGGTCLLNCCLETSLIYLSISRSFLQLQYKTIHFL
jgi:hypothetical protein